MSVIFRVSVLADVCFNGFEAAAARIDTKQKRLACKIRGLL